MTNDERIFWIRAVIVILTNVWLAAWWSAEGHIGYMRAMFWLLIVASWVLPWWLKRQEIGRRKNG